MSMKLTEERKRRVLGITSTGYKVYAILGAEDPAGGTGGSGTGTATKDKDDKTGEPKDDPRDTPDETDPEVDRLARRLAAADRAKGDLQRQLDEINSRDKTELQKAQDELAKAVVERDAAIEAKNKALVHVEFLKFPGNDWHDPETALALVDLSDVEFDAEKGKVTGVKEAVQKLAKAKPFLLKTTQGDGKGGGKKDDGAPADGAPPSGHSPNETGTKPDDKQGQRDALIRKYKL